MGRDLVVFISYKHGSVGPVLAESGRRYSPETDPRLVTLGFRKVFWRVFSDGATLEAAAHVDWLGQSFTASRIRVLHSGADLMDGMEGEDVVVALSLTADAEAADAISHIGQARIAAGIDEGGMVASLVEALGASVFGRILGSFSTDFPGVQLWAPSAEGAPGELEEVRALLGCFYFYGWLVIQRLDRDQVDIGLTPGSGGISRGMEAIARERVRLINLDRFFLTSNRSTLPDVQAICNELIDHFRLRERYLRHVSLNDSMERHLTNTTQLLQARRSRALNRSMSVLTFLAIPMGIFSTIMAMSLSADAIRRPGFLIGETRLWFVAALSFGLPVVVMLAAFFVDRLRRRRL